MSVVSIADCGLSLAQQKTRGFSSLGVEGLLRGFRVEGLGFGVKALGLRVWAGWA